MRTRFDTLADDHQLATEIDTAWFNSSRTKRYRYRLVRDVNGRRWLYTNAPRSQISLDLFGAWLTTHKILGVVSSARLPSIVMTAQHPLSDWFAIEPARFGAYLDAVYQLENDATDWRHPDGDECVTPAES